MSPAHSCNKVQHTDTQPVCQHNASDIVLCTTAGCYTTARTCTLHAAAHSQQAAHLEDLFLRGFMQDAIKLELQDRSAHLHEQGCV